MRRFGLLQIWGVAWYSVAHGCRRAASGQRKSIGYCRKLDATITLSGLGVCSETQVLSHFSPRTPCQTRKHLKLFVCRAGQTRLPGLPGRSHRCTAEVVSATQSPGFKPRGIKTLQSHQSRHPEPRKSLRLTYLSAIYTDMVQREIPVGAFNLRPCCRFPPRQCHPKRPQLRHLCDFCRLAFWEALAGL